MESVDVVSIRPDRISVYRERLPSSLNLSFPTFEWGPQEAAISDSCDLPVETNSSQILQPNSNKAGAVLSEKAKKRIQERVDWLVLFAHPKKAYNPKTKKSFTFKINFITLTLPVLQMHDDRTLKAKCLNQFFTETRKRCNLRNYVWRAEAQANGSIHFHIISDVYMNAYIIREIWNRCLNKLGYIDSYTNKFSNLSFRQYQSAVDPLGEVPVSALLRRFEYGRETKWKQPNSTDIHSTKHVRNIAAYLKKYISKNIDYAAGDGTPELQGRRIKGRLWGCSQSLSKMKPITEYLPSGMADFVNDVIETFPEKTRYFDYATCIYVPLMSYFQRHAHMLRRLLKKLLLETDYRASRQKEQRYYLDSTISFSY